MWEVVEKGYMIIWRGTNEMSWTLLESQLLLSITITDQDGNQPVIIILVSTCAVLIFQTNFCFTQQLIIWLFTGVYRDSAVYHI